MKKVMFNNSELSGSFGQESTPIGTILMYGGTRLPFGFLWCNGSAVSRTVYADLFNAIGTAFGSGDGSTTFNLPDYRESVPIGAGHNDTQTIANHDEYTVGQFKDDQFKAHTHNVTIANNSGTPYFYNHTSSTTARAYLDSKTYTTSSEGSGDTTHGKQLGCNFIIKFCKAITPAQEQFIDDSVVSAEKTWSSNKINAQNSYSTSEVDTGKTWIDGKKIYRKVFEFNADTLIISDSSWRNIGTVSSDIGTLIDWKTAYFTTNHPSISSKYGIMDISKGSTNGNALIRVQTQGNIIKVAYNGSISEHNYIVPYHIGIIVEFTKL